MNLYNKFVRPVEEWLYEWIIAVVYYGILGIKGGLVMEKELVREALVGEDMDAVVPHGYGLTGGATLDDRQLMDGTTEALFEARVITTRFPNAVLYLVSTGYWKEEREREETLKLKAYYPLKAGKIIAVQAGARNTVDEVREVTALFNDRIKKGRIVVVADIVQIPRVKRIWRHFCPEATIKFVAVVARWDGSHRERWLKSPLRWLVANWLAHTLLVVKGVEGAGKSVHVFKQA